MTASSIGAGSGGGYVRYLESKTIAPSRGDYYLGRTSETTQSPGRWLARQDTLGRLGIDGSRVEGADFVALMEGRLPGSERHWRRMGANGERGGGIDVTFSAPKSVSVVWALAGEEQRLAVEAAHAAAVEEALAYMRDEVATVRRRYGGAVVEETAQDLIAAEYRHTTARGVTGVEVPDPQLHSHVVICGAVRRDGELVAVSSRPIFRAAREVGAFYRGALAVRLAEQGYRVEARTGKQERYFELAGVPRGLAHAMSGRSREVERASARFAARYGRQPARDELRNIKLQHRRAKELSTISDLQAAWVELAREHSFDRRAAARLHGGASSAVSWSGSLEQRVQECLTRTAATFELRELRATVIEQATGELHPSSALERGRRMLRTRDVVGLEGDRYTTLQQRAKEQQVELHLAAAAARTGHDTGRAARRLAGIEVAERLGGPLSTEQQQAVDALTGRTGVAVLIGPAGSGKGVVLDAAARAERHAGRRTLAVAVAGSTAERLGIDSPALEGQTMTVNSFVAKAERGTLELDTSTTVYFDEAGMADTERLSVFSAAVDAAGAKAVLVGDAAQLSSIGPGGMFERISRSAPVIVELGEIHRTKDPAEQRAWAAMRNGTPELAIAHYQHRGQLHMRNTREDSSEAAVKRWSQLAQKHGISEVGLIADASNKEIDRLNARAQHLRAEHGELGDREVELASTHYGLREGDRVALIQPHYQPGEPVVRNGSIGHVTAVSDDGDVTVMLASGRQVAFTGGERERLRLAYAQHVNRQQGATFERTVVLTGGWQADKERVYVEASRARHGTDWFLSREDLGTDGPDELRVKRFTKQIRTSRQQTPSLQYAELELPSVKPVRERSPVKLQRAIARLTPQTPETGWRRRTQREEIGRGR